ncbi:phage head closure protein [Bacillus sp. FJAT-49732]|uniref:Phage head closure protein n=1 Tax=Lederbergia citrisecunda TaxID=2833583 RepID=A0A942TMI7_9BACI|nr:phage head closure protein [Lederbergia citrisecunda]MBS4198614.1 phage head closure protein [Lederbergia citrisecunda]
MPINNRNSRKYIKRLTFQKKEKTKDKEGNTVTDWVDKFTVWGSIKGLRGRDFIDAGAQAVKISTRIYIRYRPGVTSDMRIKYGKRIFDIVNPNNIEERNIEYEILANEVNLNG